MQILTLINPVGGHSAARVKKLIVELSPLNSDIEYEVGTFADGEFTLSGLDHHHLDEATTSALDAAIRAGAEFESALIDMLRAHGVVA